MNNLSKDEARRQYVAKRNKKEYKDGLVRSIIQVLVVNSCAIILIGVLLLEGFNTDSLIITIIMSLFAIGLDVAFYDTYISKIEASKKNTVKEEKTPIDIYYENELRKLNAEKEKNDLKTKVFCTNCGKEIDYKWKYCKFCGSELENNNVNENFNKVSDKNFSHEEENYINVMMNNSKGIVDRIEAEEFMNVLKIFNSKGKNDALNEFDVFIKKSTQRKGPIKSISIRSFFLGVMNSNGIINEKEMNDLGKKYQDELLDMMMKEKGV